MSQRDQGRAGGFLMLVAFFVLVLLLLIVHAHAADAPPAPPQPKCTYPAKMDVSLSFEAIQTIGATLNGVDHSYAAHQRALAELADAIAALNKKFCK